MNYSKERRTYIDFMRICAVFLVMFNHLPGYNLFQISEGYKTWIYTFITMFTRINVPIFFMITGSLLLGRDEGIGEIFRKRISKIMMVLFLFGALFYFVSGLPNVRFDVGEFIRKLLAGTIMQSYWYLYAYISFLVILPYLRRIVCGFKCVDFAYIMIIHFCICTLIPILNYILAICGKEGIVLASELNFSLMIVKMMFYPIIGYYIDCIVDIHKMKKKHVLMLVIGAFCGMFIESFITIHQGRTFGTYTQNYVQLFDYIIAIVFFLLVKYLFECKGFLLKRDAIQKGICTIGGLTLGMYVLDPVWKTVFWWKFQSVLEPFLPTLLVSICWCLMSMLGSGVVSFVLKKIPGVKRII